MNSMADYSAAEQAEIEAHTKALAPFDKMVRDTIKSLRDAIPNRQAYDLGTHEAFICLVATLCKEVRDLKEQFDARPVGLSYEGVWQADKSYHSGVFVTDAGSMWFAKEASLGRRPGSGGHWQLAVKKGRDAK